MDLLAVGVEFGDVFGGGVLWGGARVEAEETGVVGVEEGAAGPADAGGWGG